VATLKSIAVAGIPMTAVPSEFPDAADNAMNSDQTAGNLGLPIFSRFRLITDYPHNALWLIPDTSELAQPFGKNRSGLLGFPAVDRMKVLFVAPGSPAEKAGWKEGSEIVAVDGHRIDADFAASVQSHWSQQPAGTVVTLTLADGTTQQLILADYY
jgi:membrane-associated protease RseP (regulator of RpoE activity)